MYSRVVPLLLSTFLTPRNRVDSLAFGSFIRSECTSAVSIDVEKKLYESAVEKNITSITISQRLALEEFHTQQLKLGDANGENGWNLKQLDKK